MLEDLKTYCMVFIQLIQTNPARKGADFSFDLSEVSYGPKGLHAVYKDTQRNQLYDIVITSRHGDDTRFLTETL